MTNAKEKNKAGTGTRKCQEMHVAIPDTGAKEGLTEKVTFQ